MGLSKGSLKGKLMSIYASPSAAAVTAVKLAGAIASYWSSGQSNVGTSPITGGAKAIMVVGFLPVFLSLPGSPSAASKKIGNVIHGAFLSMPVGSGGIASASKGGLIKKIEVSYSNNMSQAPHAQKFSAAVHSYSTGASLFGPGGEKSLS